MTSFFIMNYCYNVICVQFEDCNFKFQKKREENYFVLNEDMLGKRILYVNSRTRLIQN